MKKTTDYPTADVARFVESMNNAFTLGPTAETQYPCEIPEYGTGTVIKRKESMKGLKHD